MKQESIIIAVFALFIMAITFLVIMGIKHDRNIKEATSIKCIEVDSTTNNNIIGVGFGVMDMQPGIGIKLGNTPFVIKP